MSPALASSGAKISGSSSLAVELAVEIDEDQLGHEEAGGPRDLAREQLGHEHLGPLARAAELEDVEAEIVGFDEGWHGAPPGGRARHSEQHV